jgi:hypothetical protein
MEMSRKSDRIRWFTRFFRHGKRFNTKVTPFDYHNPEIENHGARRNLRKLIFPTCSRDSVGSE